MKYIRVLVRSALVVILLAATLTIEVVYAEAPLEPKKTSWSVEEVKVMVDSYADQYGVSRSIMHAVVKCESGYVYNVPGDKRHGAYESFGVSQIHLKDHPDVSYEEAINADFALNFMASEMKAGRSWQWSCWKKL